MTTALERCLNRFYWYQIFTFGSNVVTKQNEWSARRDAPLLNLWNSLWNWFKLPQPPVSAVALFLLTAPKRSSMFVRQCFHMCPLFCHYLFLSSPSFGASGRLCFLIVAFPGYFHIYFVSFKSPWYLSHLSTNTNQSTDSTGDRLSLSVGWENGPERGLKFHLTLNFL